jgi:hypothetical protein
MGVTRIRYLLDQWRLRSVAIGLPPGFDKERPPGDWKFPPVEDRRRKLLEGRPEESRATDLPPT